MNKEILTGEIFIALFFPFLIYQIYKLPFIYTKTEMFFWIILTTLDVFIIVNSTVDIVKGVRKNGN